MAPFSVVLTDQVFPDVELERSLLAEIDAKLEVADGTRSGALERSRGADALLNTYLPIDADFLSQLDQCRIVARYGIGVDNIDLAAAADAGITVTNVPDYCVEEVATQALAMLLALLRKLPASDRLVREGSWGISGVRPLRRVSELTVGLIGYGRIARRLAASLHQLGATVIAHDPNVADTGDATELARLDEVFERSDAISVHAPLTEETRGLIGRRELELMADDAVLVNVARGPIVVFDELVGALRSGGLGGAGLDVFEREPPDPEQLRDVPGLLTTPHTAFYSEASLREAQHKAATQIAKVLTGSAPDSPVRAG
jgi:D-3-phosphoglycerate dehydrogenase